LLDQNEAARWRGVLSLFLVGSIDPHGEFKTEQTDADYSSICIRHGSYGPRDEAMITDSSIRTDRRRRTVSAWVQPEQVCE
jgi:hypothetical protein